MQTKERRAGAVGLAQSALTPTLDARVVLAGGKSQTIAHAALRDELAGMRRPALGLGDLHMQELAVGHDVPGAVGQIQIMHEGRLPAIVPAGFGLYGLGTGKQQNGDGRHQTFRKDTTKNKFHEFLP